MKPRPLILAALAGVLLTPGFAQEARLPAPRQDAPVTPARSIAAGIKWLLKAQNRDGSWGLDAQTPAEISCTVVCALAIMAAGNTERGGPDPDSVQAIRKALDFIMKKARRVGADISGGEVTLIQNKLGHRVHTFMATVFLSQVYGQQGAWVKADDVDDLKLAISRMSERIAKSQEADGSWHKETFGSLKATCMAWLALRSAASAGIDVERAAADKTVKFLKGQYNKSTKLFDRQAGHGYQTIYSTAACLRVLYGMGEGNSPEARGATEAFMKFVKTGEMGAAFLTVEGEDYMSAAIFTHALLCVDPDARWNEWYPWITKELLKRQNKDGTWTSTACITGRTFATACALLALQAPYRMLPILEQ